MTTPPESSPRCLPYCFHGIVGLQAHIARGNEFITWLLLLSGFSRVRLSSPLGSPVPGILQARTLEWVAISFSNAWKWKVKVKSLRHVRTLATPWTAAYQASPSMGFSRQEYWRGVPLPSPFITLLTRNLHYISLFKTDTSISASY